MQLIENPEAGDEETANGNTEHNDFRQKANHLEPRDQNQQQSSQHTTANVNTVNTTQQHQLPPTPPNHLALNANEK